MRHSLVSYLHDKSYWTCITVFFFSPLLQECFFGVPTNGLVVLWTYIFSFCLFIVDWCNEARD